MTNNEKDRYGTGPRTAILMLYEDVERYLKQHGEEQFRKEVTEMRSELGTRLLDEQFDK